DEREDGPAASPLPKADDRHLCANAEGSADESAESPYTAGPKRYHRPNPAGGSDPAAGRRPIRYRPDYASQFGSGPGRSDGQHRIAASAHGHEAWPAARHSRIRAQAALSAVEAHHRGRGDP